MPCRNVGRIFFKRRDLDWSGNRKADKKRAIGHIDGVISLLMAVGIAARPAPVIDVCALIG